MPEVRTLIYREPAGYDKKDLAHAIASKFTYLEGIERNYSDRNAIMLLKVKKPRLDQVADILDCRENYLRLRSERLDGDVMHDSELSRAQVFHPFRQELEAWYIERTYAKGTNPSTVQMLPPRIVRLLEDPEMMQLFAHCIATDAVEMIEGKGWLWHGPDRDVVLTDFEDDPYADVIRAAVIFVLKQGEGRRGGLITIAPEAARHSVLQSAQDKGLTRDEMLVKFVEQRLDAFLKQHAPESMHTPLKMVFTFYCDPQTHRPAIPRKLAMMSGLRVCKTGRLFEVQNCIRQNHFLFRPIQKTTPSEVPNHRVLQGAGEIHLSNGTPTG